MADPIKFEATAPVFAIAGAVAGTAGKWAAAGTLDGDVTIWKPTDGSPVDEYVGHIPNAGGAVFALAFSPDSSVLLTAGEAGTSATRLLSTPTEVGPTDATVSALAPALSRDAGVTAIQFAAAREKKVEMWEVGKDTPKKFTKSAPSPIKSVSWGGGFIATLLNNNKLSFWDVADLNKTPVTTSTVVGEFGPVVAGTRVVTAIASPPKLHFWEPPDVTGPKLSQEILTPTDTIAVLTATDKFVFVVGTQNKKVVGMYDLQGELQGEPKPTPVAHTKDILGVAATAGDRPDVFIRDAAMVRVWRHGADKWVDAFPTMTEAPDFLSIRPDGATALVRVKDQNARLFETTGDRRFPLVDSAKFNLGVVLTDGRVVTAKDKELRQWPGDFTTAINTDEVFAAGWADPNPVALAGTAEKVRLVEFPTLVSEQLDGGKEFQAVAVSKTGKWVAAAGKDKVLRVWKDGAAAAHAKTGPLPSAVTALGINHDEAEDAVRVVSGSRDGTVAMWKITGTGANTKLVEGELPPAAVFPSAVKGAAYSPNAEKIAVLGNNGTVKIWDATNLAAGPTVVAGTPAVLSFSLAWLDKEHVVVGSADNTARVFDIT